MLVIAPHPDDETIGSGGFRLRHRGLAELHVVTVFNGEGGGRLERGPWENTIEYKAEVVATRRDEMGRVATVLGLASVQRLDVPDGTLDLQPGLVLRLRAAVERISPDIVMLPWYLDALRDHRVANVLYAWGCADLSCTVLAYEVWQMLEPNAVLDITEQLEEKLELVIITGARRHGRLFRVCRRDREDASVLFAGPHKPRWRSRGIPGSAQRRLLRSRDQCVRRERPVVDGAKRLLA